jgi:hypothetical protein
MMVGEWQIGKDVEGSNRGLIQGTIPTLSWSDWKNREKPWAKTSGNRSTGRDLKPGPPEHEAVVLTTQLRR